MGKGEGADGGAGGGQLGSMGQGNRGMRNGDAAGLNEEYRGMGWGMGRVRFGPGPVGTYSELINKMNN